MKEHIPWHREQDINKRIDYFKTFGWDILVVWKKELKNVDSLKQKLEKLVV